MDPIISRCGYRCDLCLAYRDNVERDAGAPQRLSDGWFRYFGFRIPPEVIVCDGCRSAENARRIDPSCPVRPCVIEKSLTDCADCDGSGACEKLQHRIVRFEDIQAKFQQAIPDDDRLLFIHPYENGTRLEALRRMRHEMRGGR